MILKRMRKAQGLSQTDLAKKMNMRQPTVSDIENGRGTLDSFFKVLQALGAGLSINDELIGNNKKNKDIDTMIHLIED